MAHMGFTWTLQCSSFLGLFFFLDGVLIKATKKVLHWRVLVGFGDEG